MLNPQANIGVLSRQTELVRLRARAAFAIAVRGADDAPHDASATQLIQGLYAAHLALLLLWSQDRSADSKSTHAALSLFAKLISQIRRARWLPGSGGLSTALATFVAPSLILQRTQLTPQKQKRFSASCFGIAVFCPMLKNAKAPARTASAISVLSHIFRSFVDSSAPASPFISCSPHFLPNRPTRKKSSAAFRHG